MRGYWQNGVAVISGGPAAVEKKVLMAMSLRGAPEFWSVGDFEPMVVDGKLFLPAVPSVAAEEIPTSVYPAFGERLRAAYVDDTGTVVPFDSSIHDVAESARVHCFAVFDEDNVESDLIEIPSVHGQILNVLQSRGVTSGGSIMYRTPTGWKARGGVGGPSISADPALTCYSFQPYNRPSGGGTDRLISGVWLDEDTGVYPNIVYKLIATWVSRYTYSCVLFSPYSIVVDSQINPPGSGLYPSQLPYAAPGSVAPLVSVGSLLSAYGLGPNGFPLFKKYPGAGIEQWGFNSFYVCAIIEVVS